MQTISLRSLHPFLFSSKGEKPHYFKMQLNQISHNKPFISGDGGYNRQPKDIVLFDFWTSPPRSPSPIVRGGRSFMIF